MYTIVVDESQFILKNFLSKHVRYQHSKLFAVFPEKDPSQMSFQHFNKVI